MYALAEKYKADIVVGNACEYYNQEIQNPLYRDKCVFFEREMFKEDFLIEFIKTNSLRIAACFNLYKREFIIQNNLFFKAGILHEDELFTPKVLLKSSKIAIYPEEFYGYRQREGSIMKSKNNIKRSIDLLNTFEELISIYDKIDNKKLKNILNNRNYNLIISTILNYDIEDISYTLRVYLIKNSVSIKSLIINFIGLFSINIYRKILNKLS